jgi:hypothetical protein
MKVDHFSRFSTFKASIWVHELLFSTRHASAAKNIIYRRPLCPTIQCSNAYSRRHNQYFALIAARSITPIHAGFLVRVVAKIKPEGKSFVAVAIYITKQSTAEGYLVYQLELNNKAVEIPKSSIADHNS